LYLDKQYEYCILHMHSPPITNNIIWDNER